MGVTHPSETPLTVASLEETEAPQTSAAPTGGIQMPLAGVVDDEASGPVAQLVQDGVFYLSEGEMGVEDVQRPRRPAPLAWIEQAVEDRERQGYARVGVRCVAWNIDSLYLAIYADIAPGVLGRLLDLNELARNRGDADPVFIASGGRQWRMTWAPAPYAFRLEIESVASIKVAKRVGPHAPQIYAEIRAKALWEYGPDRIVDELTQMIRSWETPRPEPTRVDVSRIDLAADFVGLDLDGTELPGDRWVTRALHRGMFFKAGRAGKVTDPKWEPSTSALKRARIKERQQREADQVGAVYYRGRTYTGGAFGTGDVRVRHYRKDIEMKAKGGAGAWQRTFWRAGGWQKGQGVMRVEAQLRGAALRSIVGTATSDTAVGRGKGAGVWQAGDVTVGNDWRTIRRHLDALWRYAVGEIEGTGWITLRTRGSHSRPERWPIDSRWVQVQATDWSPVVDGVGLDTVRVARMRRTPTKKHVVGHKWHMDPEDGVDPDTIEGIVEQISGPTAMRAWGDGLPKKAHRMAFGTICEESFDKSVEVLSAEERRESLRASVNGMLASLGAALAIEERRAHEPADHRHVLRWLEEEIEEADFAKRWAAARQRFALRGITGYKAARAHSRGDGRHLSGYQFAGVAS